VNLDSHSFINFEAGLFGTSPGLNNFLKVSFSKRRLLYYQEGDLSLLVVPQPNVRFGSFAD